MYAAWVASELVHVYCRRRADVADSTFSVLKAEIYARRVRQWLTARADESQGFSYASAIADLMGQQELHVKNPASPTTSQRDILRSRPSPNEEATIVDQALSEVLGTRGENTNAALPDEVAAAIWDLTETALLTLDGVKRRNSLETLSCSGLAEEVRPAIQRVALDRRTPWWLVEVATFCLAHLGESKAYADLVTLSGRFLPGRQESSPPAVRHAALWGLAEQRFERGDAELRTPDADLRHLRHFTEATGPEYADNSSERARPALLELPVARAAAYGVALSFAPERAAVLRQLASSSPDEAIRAIASWGENLLRANERADDGAFAWIPSAPASRRPERDYANDDRVRLQTLVGNRI
jgi:hypothetical protein